MTITVKRDYGNGISVEVEEDTMTRVLKNLHSCDELFFDIRCAAVVNGQRLVSDKVKFNHRTTEQGHDYFEQICVDGANDGALRWYKRSIGIYNDKTDRCFLKTRVDDKTAANSTLGLAGWHKYNGNSSGGQSYGGGQSYQQSSHQQPAASHQSQPQQQAPQQQPAYSPPQPSQSAADIDDIPF